MSAPQSLGQFDLNNGQRRLTSSSASAWGYIRHELVFLGFAVMELSLLTPVVMLFIGWARYWPAYQVFLWLLLVMLLPLNLIRLMGILNFDLKRQRRVLIIALLLTLVQSWRLLLYSGGSPFDFRWLSLFFDSLGEGGNMLWTRDLSVFLITSFTWWRGIRLAIRYPEINNAGLRLRLGGLIFFPIIAWLSSSILDENIVPFVMMFFLAALTVITLVRAENIEQERSGTAATLNASWFGVVAGAAALIVLFSGVVTALVTGESLFLVMAWLSPLWGALQFGATVSGLALFHMTYPALDIFARFVQILAAFFGGVLGQISATIRDSGLLGEPQLPEVPTIEETVDILEPSLGGRTVTAILMLGLVILIGLALARTFRKTTFTTRDSDRSRQPTDEAGDEPGMGRRVLERLGIFRQWRAAASVRRIYRLMCKQAGLAGYPRLGIETPYEYLPTLFKVWPEHAAESRLITEAFVRVRYGELPETAEELELLRSAWLRIESAVPNRQDQTDDATPTLVKWE